MKIAIAHDSLAEFGGAERVLQSLLRLYPNAHVYTAYQDDRFVKKFFPSLSGRNLSVSPIQLLSRWGYLFQFLMPTCWKIFNLEGYDAVISSSSYLLSNTIRVKRPVHIQYILGPPKNIFDLAFPNPTQKVIPYTKCLAEQYEKALKGGAHVVTISHHIQQLLQRMFKVPSDIIYPPVTIPLRPPSRHTGLYYLTVCRLDDTKEIEILIFACSQMNVPLKIVGSGTDNQYVHYLRSLAGPTVEFLGFQDDSKVQQLYKHAIAFLFSPRDEDFGIAPIEAMAHGVPVIAYHGGGAKETVVEGKTGTFFYSYTPEALMEAIRRYKPERFNPETLYNYAKQFDEKRFHKEMKQLIDSLIHEKHDKQYYKRIIDR
jgi:glycosyltransferase involved in cell wall biosynthesis